jgi:nucleoside-diphosphate-sugar epimerase
MLIMLVLRFVAPRGGPLIVPLGVIALQFFISLAGSTGARILWRTVCERAGKTNGAGHGPRNLLVLGAGFHGLTVAQEMAGSRGLRIVGFLDDDPQKIGKVIAGLPVIGPVSSLPDVVKSHRVNDVLVCLPPSARSSAALANLAESRNVRVRVIPTVQELLEQERHTTPKNGRASTPAVSAKHNWMIAPFSGKKILITGGAGFIGSSLAERLVETNRLILFDQTFTDKPIEFTSLIGHPNVQAVRGDILNDDDLAPVCREVDMVVHTAAVLGVGKVCGAARETLETNYGGTSRLLKALEANKRLERFVYFSTSEVFGVNSFRVDESTAPSVGPIAESRWSYAIAKLAGEHLVKSYYREAKMPITIVRPFNIFGPRRNGDYALRRFIMNALANQPLEVHGDGSQIRAWCFIDDFCDALVAMLSKSEAVGEDFNIGNPGNTLTVLELARKVIDIAESSSAIELVKHPFPDISIRVPSLAKAQTLLGYAPRFDLDTALALTIEWYRENFPTFAPALPRTARKAQRAVAAGV